MLHPALCSPHLFGRQPSYPSLCPTSIHLLVEGSHRISLYGLNASRHPDLLRVQPVSFGVALSHKFTRVRIALLDWRRLIAAVATSPTSYQPTSKMTPMARPKRGSAARLLLTLLAALALISTLPASHGSNGRSATLVAAQSSQIKCSASSPCPSSSPCCSAEGVCGSGAMQCAGGCQPMLSYKAS